MALWIGGGFCSGEGPWRAIDGELLRLTDGEGPGVERRLVALGRGRGVVRKEVTRPAQGEAGAGYSGVYEWMKALSARFRHVRVASGDWGRVVGPTPTFFHGLTGVFLDPPYDASRDNNIYTVESTALYAEVRRWAIENGDNPLLRIAYCCYDDGYTWPDGWRLYNWSAHGGLGNQRKNGKMNENRHREQVWFSPHCLQEQQQMSLF